MPRIASKTTDVDAWNNFASSIEFQGDCWYWIGAVAKKTGYGVFSVQNNWFLAHRFSYYLFNGHTELPLDHLCRNRACVNPEHLEPVTLRENVLRGEGLAAINFRKTHCIKGHEFSTENTYYRPDRTQGNRCCKICRNEASARARDKRLAIIK